MDIRFDYFYGETAERYAFYRTPKVLYTDDYFRKMDFGAKALYGILLDRVSLSVRNSWRDDENRIYIIFPLQEIQETAGCSKKTAVKLLKELEDYGLIEKKRCGQCKPNLIYVKDFSVRKKVLRTKRDNRGTDRDCSNPEIEMIEKTLENSTAKYTQAESKPLATNRVQIKREAPQTESDNPSREIPNEGGLKKSDENFLKCKNYTSQKKSDRKCRNYTIEKQPNWRCKKYTSEKSTDQKCRNYTTGGVETALHEVEKLHPNNTDFNKTNRINLHSSCSMGREKDDSQSARYQQYFREALDYQVLLMDHPNEKQMLDGIVELLAEVCASRRKTIRLNGEEQPMEAVRSRFKQLNLEHIRYVFLMLSQTSGNVKNMSRYLLTLLYNAPVQMQAYYQMRVNYDQAQMAESHMIEKLQKAE